MKRNLKLVAGAIGAYAVIVVLLTLVESGADGSSIRTIWDAIWYSVITLTTVGYGDLSPVTGTGRVLGTILALCSLGVLSAVISISFRIIGEQFLPMAKLYRNRDKKWYVFGSSNRDSMTLAQELSKEEKCMLIFHGEDAGDSGGPDNIIYTEANLAALKDLKEGDGGITAVFMGEDPWENYCGGLAAAENSIECYCMADMMVEIFLLFVVMEYHAEVIVCILLQRFDDDVAVFEDGGMAALSQCVEELQVSTFGNAVFRLIANAPRKLNSFEDVRLGDEHDIRLYDFHMILFS